MYVSTSVDLGQAMISQECPKGPLYTFDTSARLEYDGGRVNEQNEIWIVQSVLFAISL